MPNEPLRDRPITVGIVEDDSRTRELLCALVDAAPGLRVVGDWPSAEAVLHDGAPAAPDILLLDIGLPGISGVEALAPLRERLPVTSVLMLTIFEEEEKIFEALCRGAHGYLLKNLEPARLVQSIRDAAAGGSPISPEIARQVVAFFRKTPPVHGSDQRLSAQQVRLLSLLAQGHSYQSVAREMGITINTVREYIRVVYDKLHVHSRSAAVATALRSGLI